MRSQLLALVAAAVAAVAGGLLTAMPGYAGQSDGGAPVAAVSAAQLGAPNPAIVQAALQAPLVRYNRDLPGGAYTNMGNSGGGAVIMAYAALAGDTSVDSRILQQVRYTLTGGNDIAANGGYPAQHELQVTGMFAVIKSIPRIWSQLSPAEHERVDAMMHASLVASAFTTSDRNPFIVAGQPERTLDADTNLGRDWNPNYREGMVGSILVAAAYFGVDKAETFLTSYDHAAFTQQLCDLGLDNSCATFRWKQDHPDSIAPTGAQIETAVHDWSLHGVALGDVMRLEANLAFNTYGGTVECGLNDGQGIPAEGAPDGIAGVIASGCDGLPNKGQPGMLLEFDSVDGGGPRSATYYTFSGLKPSLIVQGALIVNHLWQPGLISDQIASLVDVGAEDLWYKLEHGYRNYSIGSYHGIQTINDPGYGFGYIRSLWSDVLAPYHGIIPAPRVVLASFDSSVASGGLTGTGSGDSPDHRLQAFRQQLADAGDLVTAGDFGDARQALPAILRRIHVGGPLQPWQQVTGADAGVLHGLVERLGEALPSG